METKRKRSKLQIAFNLTLLAIMVLALGAGMGYFPWVKDSVRAVVNDNLEGEAAPTIEAKADKVLLPAGMDTAPDVDEGWRVLAFFKST